MANQKVPRGLLLNSLPRFWKSYGHYFLIVGFILSFVAVATLVCSSAFLRRLASGLFTVFGSWLVVAASYWAGKYFGNKGMREKIIRRAYGEIGIFELMIIRIEALVGALFSVGCLGLIGAGENGLLPFFEKDLRFHITVAAIVVSVPVLLGVNGEIKRWLAGMQDLSKQSDNAGRTNLHWTSIAAKLDRFPDKTTPASEDF